MIRRRTTVNIRHLLTYLGVATLFGILLLPSCSHSASSERPLTLVYMNSIHGQLDPCG